MNSYGKTDVGLVRTSNQDAFCIVSKDNFQLAVVCDGMGGHKAGEVASQMSVDIMSERFAGSIIDDISQWLTESYDEVNSKVYLKAYEDEDCEGMGTTMVAFFTDGKNCYLSNTGDSRGYILKNSNELVQITDDHSLVNEIVHRDGIDYEQACKIIPSNIITQAIGIYPKTRVDIFRIEDEFKTVLLCSDGLHGYVSDEEIREILIQDVCLMEKVDNLIELAKQKGAPDNVTAVLLGE